jgi:hypothetical protein
MSCFASHRSFMATHPTATNELNFKPVLADGQKDAGDEKLARNQLCIPRCITASVEFFKAYGPKIRNYQLHRL